MDLTDSDVLMGLVPMFHGYGMLLICFCMTLGCKIVILKYFEEELFLKSIEVHKVCIKLCLCIYIINNFQIITKYENWYSSFTM